MLDLVKNSTKTYVIGVDEVGYGCLAGPIVVCAARTPREWSWPRLDDSKKLTEKRRNIISQELQKSGQLTFNIVQYDSVRVDAYAERGENVGNALRDMYAEAIRGLDQSDSLIILDGIHKIQGIDHISLPKADGLVQATSAASVLAKVYRDNLMIKEALKYPGYSFEKNKGYGTKDHLNGLMNLGPCRLHRFCYEPVKSRYKKEFLGLDK